MLGTLRSRATYPYVASTLALFLALGTGGAYAVDEFPAPISRTGR